MLRSRPHHRGPSSSAPRHRLGRSQKRRSQCPGTPSRLGGLDHGKERTGRRHQGGVLPGQGLASCRGPWTPGSGAVVAHLLWEQEVAGSNPVSPTTSPAPRRTRSRSDRPRTRRAVGPTSFSHPRRRARRLAPWRAVDRRAAAPRVDGRRHPGSISSSATTGASERSVIGPPPGASPWRRRCRGRQFSRPQHDGLIPQHDGLIPEHGWPYRPPPRAMRTMIGCRTLAAPSQPPHHAPRPLRQEPSAARAPGSSRATHASTGSPSHHRTSPAAGMSSSLLRSLTTL
jgi:hypothetical protein